MKRSINSVGKNAVVVLFSLIVLSIFPISASAEFQPDELNGLAVWLKADGVTGVNDGDSLPLWEASAGTNSDFSQSVSDQQPTYIASVPELNGQPAIRFDNDRLLSNNTNFSFSNFSIFIAYRENGNVKKNEQLINHGVQDGFWLARNKKKQNTWGGGVQENRQRNGIFGPMADFAPHIIYLERDTTRVELYGDGLLINRKDVLATPTQPNPISIGGRIDSGNTRGTLTGDIAEVIIFSRALNDEERSTIEEYLGQKYYIPTGYVGIGTSEPQAKLSVNGQIQIIPRREATCHIYKEGSIYYDSEDKKHFVCERGHWTPVLTGSVGEVNIKSFGAEGDGITDDTAAIQAAVDSVPSTGGKVYLPPGNYKISAPINLRTSNLSFVGAGAPATTLSYEGLSQMVVIQALAGAPVSNVLIKGIRFTNPLTGFDPNVGHGRGTIQTDTFLGNISDVTITEIFIDSTAIVGMVLGGERILVSNNTIRDTGQHGIYIVTGKDVRVHGNKLYRIGKGSPICCQSNIILVQADNVIISNNSISDFRDNTNGILVGDATKVAITGNTISLSDANQNGIRLHSGSVTVVGNIIDGGAGYSNAIGIDVKEGRGALISDNQLLGTWNNACIVVRAIVEDVNIDHVIIPNGRPTGWMIDLTSSKRPVVQNSSILSGTFGIDLGKTDGAKIINNQILTQFDYKVSGPPTNFKIWEP
jgi:hypothetical protein